jgi:transposase-like protein
MKRYTIADFNRQFPNDDACLEWVKNHVYPNGITCKLCGKITSHSKLSNIPVYSCNRCGAHTHPTTGTIFEGSRTPLKSWFYAMFLMSATRCGISAKQLQRELGVTYKTAFRMFHLIRSLLQDTQEPICGEIEIDDAYIGGKRHGKAGRGAEGKMPVLGIAQRDGIVSVTATNDLKSSTVYPIIRKQVLKYSLVFTDEYNVYEGLSREHYFHQTINHKAKKWVSDKVHTNTIEGFWSALKRGINGVYHAVSEKYLQSYINEYAFRYNHRKDEQPMFLTILGKV